MAVITSSEEECVIYIRGWTLSFHTKTPLEQKLEWKDVSGDSIDNRSQPQNPAEVLKKLRPLTKQERHAAKSRAFGVILGHRKKALKKKLYEVEAKKQFELFA